MKQQIAEYGWGIIIGLFLSFEYHYWPSLAVITAGIFIGRLVVRTSN